MTGFRPSPAAGRARLHSRAPLRPREPGERRPGASDPTRISSRYLVAMTAGGLAAIILAAVVVVRSASSSDNGSSEPAGAAALSQDTTTHDPSRPLPLDLVAVDFTGGTSVDSGADQGPGAVGFCRHAPATTGLDGWRANQLTDSTGERRIVQLVAHFRSSIQAANYLSSNVAIASCQSWAAGSSDRLTLFSLSQQPPANPLGDETRRFELAASTGDSNLFLRTLLIRRDRDVVSLTYVSGDRTDLDRIDDLAALAVSRLTQG